MSKYLQVAIVVPIRALRLDAERDTDLIVSGALDREDLNVVLQDANRKTDK